MFNLFRTNKGSEMLFPQYGIDMEYVREHPLISTKDAFRYAVMDAMNPDNIYGIKYINSIDVDYRDGVGTVNINLLMSGKEVKMGLNIEV